MVPGGGKETMEWIGMMSLASKEVKSVNHTTALSWFC